MTTIDPGTRNATALATAVERWNAGDLPGYLQVYADDIRLHGYSPEPMDKAGVETFYQGIFAAFPENHLELHETFGDGDRLTTRFTLTGRHDGDFMGVAPTGTRITLPGITILHFREGAIVERWSCSDMLGLLVQLGAVPAPR
ncbi:ester cyclase [Actinomycetospora cinnamomea]|uniref:Steroid delta-isomerase-like uncharacterized protein n=1 Tax=Actinomycetospora cinnamomea TaxID=663609 RepID=A0A2U1FMB1_9PSEU|nr:ester cyclase [Actinomycetospora cinnamomea]PVZ13304.1 steroid delta-isomerase-like uncharacterized protein [Actinomycetospora cinnamomea]